MSYKFINQICWENLLAVLNRKIRQTHYKYAILSLTQANRMLMEIIFRLKFFSSAIYKVLNYYTHPSSAVYWNYWRIRRVVPVLAHKIYRNWFERIFNLDKHEYNGAKLGCAVHIPAVGER